jgi:hypothetical protein
VRPDEVEVGAGVIVEGGDILLIVKGKDGPLVFRLPVEAAVLLADKLVDAALEVAGGEMAEAAGTKSTDGMN